MNIKNIKTANDVAVWNNIQSENLRVCHADRVRHCLFKTD